MSDAEGQPLISAGGDGHRPTRRQLVAGLGLAVAAVVAPSQAEAAAVAGGSAGHASVAQDQKILEGLLRTERLLQYAYEQALTSRTLGQASQGIVVMLLDQEFAHSRALEHQLAAMVLRTPSHQARPTHPEPFPPPAVAALFKQVRTEAGAIKAVVDIESLAESNYFDAVAGLADPRLVQMAAQILASEAQHWTLLAALLHQGHPEAAVPHPYVRGSQHLLPL
jgi:hypothetical protein